MREAWAAELERLAARPLSLSSFRDPERPHMRLSQWRADLRKLAASIRANERPGAEGLAVVNGRVNVLAVRQVWRDETAEL